MKYIIQIILSMIMVVCFLVSGTSSEKDSDVVIIKQQNNVIADKLLTTPSSFKETQQMTGAPSHIKDQTDVDEPSNDEEQRITVQMYNARDNKAVELSIDDYLVGVLASEMPAYYSIEALKAQAVAARTYLLNKMENGGCTKYGEYDICNSCGHCQGYQTAEERKNRWGSGYEKYEQKMLEAVTSTADEYLTYDDQLINAMYHSSSAGYTEDCSQRYGSEYKPYLVSVSTPENIESVTSESYFEYGELVKLILAEYADCGVNIFNVIESISITQRTSSGRVAKVKIGNVTVSGVAFARLLSQRSTDISIKMLPGKLYVQCRGNGHGIGMSQVGANIMANNGLSYAEILSHYYQGTAIKKVIPDMLVKK